MQAMPAPGFTATTGRLAHHDPNRSPCGDVVGGHRDFSGDRATKAGDADHRIYGDHRVASPHAERCGPRWSAMPTAGSQGRFDCTHHNHLRASSNSGRFARLVVLKGFRCCPAAGLLALSGSRAARSPGLRPLVRRPPSEERRSLGDCSSVHLPFASTPFQKTGSFAVS
jgi:hypothetical protein